MGFKEMSKCILCGYDDGGTSDTAHRCKSPLSAHTGMFSQPQVKMTADKMREDFEAWAVNKNIYLKRYESDLVKFSDLKGEYVNYEAGIYWESWQASTEQSTAKIELMQARIDKSIDYFNGILALSSSGSSAHAIALEALAKVKDVK